MSSVIFFRLHHGRQSEQISFEGNGLKLLELKKQIIERKSFSGFDFDLKVVDENDSEKLYVDDDEIVPKNASVVVRRVPAKNTATSLISRINNAATGKVAHVSNNDANRNSMNSIVIQVKEEEKQIFKSSNPEPLTSSVAQAEFASSEIVADEESAALKAISTTDKSATDFPGANRPINRRPGFVPPQPPTAGSFRVPLGYQCHRCGQSGHYIKYCPTNGDPTFDPVNRLLNVPAKLQEKFASLEGIDVANKTVVQNTDGSYQVFQPTKAGREKIARESESGAALNQDFPDAPEELKCPLSKTLLREAVILPCCRACVNDAIIRQELVSSGLKCPLCKTDNVSPDSLIVQREVRDKVEAFVTNAIRKSTTIVENLNETNESHDEANEFNPIKSQFDEFLNPSKQEANHMTNGFQPPVSIPMMHPHAPDHMYGGVFPTMGMMGPPGPDMMMPPIGGHPMGMFGSAPPNWTCAADIPMEYLLQFPPLLESEFRRDQVVQIDEANFFEQRRKQVALEKKQQRSSFQSKSGEVSDKGRDNSRERDRGRSRSRSKDRRDRRDDTPKDKDLSRKDSRGRSDKESTDRRRDERRRDDSRDRRRDSDRDRELERDRRVNRSRDRSRDRERPKERDRDYAEKDRDSSKKADELARSRRSSDRDRRGSDRPRDIDERERERDRHNDREKQPPSRRSNNDNFDSETRRRDSREGTHEKSRREKEHEREKLDSSKVDNRDRNREKERHRKRSASKSPPSRNVSRKGDDNRRVEIVYNDSDRKKNGKR